VSDFLQELERELTAAAQRRSAQAQNQPRRRGLVWLEDLRAMSSGALLAASVGVVVVVVAVLATSGIHHPTATRTPAAGRSGQLTAARPGCGGPAAKVGRVDSAAGPQLSGLLRVGRLATARERRAALRDLDRTASGATAVYVRDIRVLELPSGMRVTLLGAQSCMTVGPRAPRAAASPRPSVVAEISAPHGVVTLLLGSVAQIRSGAAFRARSMLLKHARGLEFVTMVPPAVLRIICPATHRTALRQFPVVDHLAVLPASAVDSDCRLSDRQASRSNA
jgi:hypothetical protein